MRRFGSNMTKTNDGERLARNFTPTKQGLVLFNTLLGQTLLAQLAHVIDAIDDASTAQKQAANDEFHDGIGIGARRVEDGNAELRHACHGNIVGTRAATVVCSIESEREKKDRMWREGIIKKRCVQVLLSVILFQR